MKTLYLDLNMGAAGDMLSAALYELLSDGERAEFLKELREAGIPDVSVEAKDSVKCGIKGTHFEVRADGEEEISEDVRHDHHGDHHHDHHDHVAGYHHGGHGCDGDHHHDDHDHHDHAADHHHGGHGHDHGHDHDDDDHHHIHTSMQDIENLVGNLKLPDKVREDVLNVYRIVAEAESRAHGTDVSLIHFHELGMMDAVCDIAAVCLAMNKLGVERVLASEVCTGYGQVRCQHGIMPVPAPATAYILKGIPAYGGRIEGELCTPTGAALIKYFVSDFGPMPVMSTEKIGYGMGKKDFEAANCVRATLGSVEDQSKEALNESMDRVTGLSCNIDDMTGEEIGFAMDMLYRAGALEVFTVAAGMKKSRPGTVLTVLCREEDRASMIAEIFKHTSTIGIREVLYNRYVLDRSIKESDSGYGKIRIKESSGYGIKREKAEFEDLSAIALKQGISLSEARKLIRGADRDF